ncbi:MAG TPA: glycosyltransferase [Thermoanaerobaculia bacterium]|jgi:spore maturation protein CgeB|nr:glycosyltransferase [Thermoanaerobaculia bacterium]
MNILYSFNKKGFEAHYWQREIAAASGDGVTFIPFNHDPYVPTSRYARAQLLDALWYDRDPGLLRMYDDMQALVERHRVDALIVDNAFPYHPEFLRTLRVYKVLRTTDGPLVAYDRDFAYVHAYDHVLYHSPAYSRDLGMEEKLRYVGARRTDFWPLALFDQMFEPEKDEQALMSQKRDVDIVFVGALFPNKMPLLARVKKAFGKRVHLHGLTSWKRNLYFNAKYGMPGWVRPIEFEEYVPLYQRSRIGINVHNRGAYTVGSFRLFELPGNGVMQISDGGAYLSSWFDVGQEIVGYDDADELVKKVAYYLDHEDERVSIAAAGHRAVMQRHRLRTRMHEAVALIRAGMRE